MNEGKGEVGMGSRPAPGDQEVKNVLAFWIIIAVAIIALANVPIARFPLPLASWHIILLDGGCFPKKYVTQKVILLLN